MQLVSDPRAQNESIKNELMESLEEVLDSGWYILGNQVEKFEQKFAEFCKTKHCIGVGNGTDAITLTLLGLGIGPGDEVICPSLTATFTALAISAAGATPVFADINEETYTIDPNDIEHRITNKTKAIIPVHLYGHPADMDPIIKIAKKHHLFVVEDACQAHGAEYKNQRVGSIGDAGCFSFYPTKNLGGLGDGGAITTNDSALAKKLEMVRNGGQETRYSHVLLGRNSRLDELQAAILLKKMLHLEKWNSTRKEIADLYIKELGSASLIMPIEANWASSVYHQFVIRAKNRSELMKKLFNKEIQTQIHYPIPTHLQPIYKNGATLPITERVCEEIISLPIYPELKLDKVKLINQLIKESL